MKTSTNIRQVSEIKVSYSPKIKARDRFQIKHSQDAYTLLLKEAFDPETIDYKEYVKLISLDKSHKAVGITTISEGGMDGSVVDIRLILQIALLTHSSALILAHNHPSGTLQPSRQDDIITKRLKEAAMLMDITLCDHLIVCEDGYYSYADENKL